MWRSIATGFLLVCILYYYYYTISVVLVQWCNVLMQCASTSTTKIVESSERNGRTYRRYLGRLMHVDKRNLLTSLLVKF